MGSTPAVVLVHGFWGGAAHWGKVILALRSLGYDAVHAVENPLTSLADDAARTRQMLAQIDGPVVLVGHSYGGAVITEAGDAPNVVALVYVAAFAPDAGESLAVIAAHLPPEGAAAVAPDSDGFLWLPRAAYHDTFCQDLPEEEAYVMAVTQKAPVASTFGDPVTAPAWHVRPAFYQVSTRDRLIHPDNQRRMAERAGARDILELDSSHASLASRPTEIAAFIDTAARATT